MARFANLIFVPIAKVALPLNFSIILLLLSASVLQSCTFLSLMHHVMCPAYRSQEWLWLCTEFQKGLSAFKRGASFLELLQNDLNGALFQARFDAVT